MEGKSEEYFEVLIKGKVRKILLREIYYFESCARIVFAHTRYGVVQFYGKLSDVEEKLQNKSFIRCHQRYLVNKKYIMEILKTELRLHDRFLPISRKYQGKIKLE